MRYLILLCAVACSQPRDTLPKDKKAADLLCADAVNCKLIPAWRETTCQACVEDFFETNGGEERFRGIISEKLDGTCEDLRSLGEAAGVFVCIDRRLGKPR